MYTESKTINQNRTKNMSILKLELEQFKTGYQEMRKYVDLYIFFFVFFSWFYRMYEEHVNVSERKMAELRMRNCILIVEHADVYCVYM